MALKWRHAGEACITANRVYIQKGVYEKFAIMLEERTRKLKMVHGIDEGATLGPLTVPNSLNKAAAQVEDAKKYGGYILLGGNRVASSEGFFFEPTIIKYATAGLLITREESFTPICALYSFDAEEDVVKTANNTSVRPPSYPP